jgi:gamma-glutamylcyclotransferase (GGCT)/AIG2-like uncharacterized protein YtfP
MVRAEVGTSMRFFVYGTMMTGEQHHATLLGANPISTLRTAPGYSIVELGALAALIEEGSGSVVGELYDLDPAAVKAVMQQPEHPGLFQLARVRLADGSTAEAFILHVDQVRGKRRVREGDWRARFGGKKPGELSPAGPFVRWSRTRVR